MSNIQILARARRAWLVAVCLCLFLPTAATAQKRATYTNPVIAGDFPDPSVIRVGDDYWTTATSGEWAPIFLVMHSRDLVHWEAQGAVLPNRPSWAANSFWAPELQQFGNRFYVYYTARMKHGPLCVAVASAAAPQGPYTDHGTLVCQEIGSIDAVATADENGDVYLIWKEDGNSRNQPTPLWAQKLSADGTRLVGSRKELFRNNPTTWEGGVVEGAFVVRRGEWFYLFYSGNACCGRRCDYALGVARARKLLGPWEKNPANPILAANNVWQCPGHGSIVTNKQGTDYLLYHAYRKSDEAFHIGREALLDEVKWNANGWPSINDGRGPSATAARPPASGIVVSQDSFYDEFDAPVIGASWQWPQWNVPALAVETESGGRLSLSATDKKAKDPLAALVTQRAPGGDYVATAAVNLAELARGVSAGLSAYGDQENALGVAAGGGEIRVWRMVSKGRRNVATAKTTAQRVTLRMTSHDGARYRFAYSVDGKAWTPVGDEVDGTHLGSVRIALNVGGAPGAVGKFEWLRIEPVP
ncbi:MAG: xylan 1,4-beta-xylosidase [Pyrinomonadaceae bacterium]|jgi:beta-xylosidase|nr:xylan 1,4-beta-xylosidase [Pyrinomonadaceae bacterium]